MEALCGVVFSQVLLYANDVVGLLWHELPLLGGQGGDFWFGHFQNFVVVGGYANFATAIGQVGCRYEFSRPVTHSKLRTLFNIGYVRWCRSRLNLKFSQPLAKQGVPFILLISRVPVFKQLSRAIRPCCDGPGSFLFFSFTLVSLVARPYFVQSHWN